MTGGEVRGFLRRHHAGAVVGVTALLALMTGPAGSQNAPYAGLTGSFAPLRLLVLLAIVSAVSAAAANRHLLRRAPQPGTAAASTFRDRVAAARRRPGGRFASPVLILAAAVALPFIVAAVDPAQDAFWETVLVDRIGVYVLLALGLNVVVGFAGLLDLGYIAFFAIGAYSAAYWTGRLPVHPPFTLNPWLVLPVAAVTAMVAGAALGAPTLRLRGDYLAIVTLGFGEIVRITALNSDSVTNGPRGSFGIPHYSIGGRDFGLSPRPYYFAILALIVAAVVAFSRLERSAVGRAWVAIREDEVAAAATGIRTVRVKLLAFSIGASTAGLAGSFYADKVGFISPDNFLFLFSMLVLVYVIFGGMGSIAGVIAGAAILEWLPQFLRDRVPPTDRYIYFGALIVVMMIFRPQGLIPSRRRARELKSPSVVGAGTGMAGAAGADLADQPAAEEQ